MNKREKLFERRAGKPTIRAEVEPLLLGADASWNVKQAIRILADEIDAILAEEKR